jgi:predicted enzyme related to lactoylglutathione lyase
MTLPRDIFQVEIRIRSLASAVPFYHSVFDWKIFNAAEDQAVVDTGAMPIVSMLQTANPMFPLGAANYVRVEDVEREAERAVALGGHISVPKNEVANAGYFLGVRDPWGAEMLFWQTFEHVEPHPHGSGQNPVSYIEIQVPNREDAIKYYSELMGWSFSSASIAHVPGLKRGVGIFHGPPSVIDYVEVKSLDETIDRIGGAGGKIVVPPTEFPGEGRYIVFEDPDGIAMGAIEA